MSGIATGNQARGFYIEIGPVGWVAAAAVGIVAVFFKERFANVTVLFIGILSRRLRIAII